MKIKNYFKQNSLIDFSYFFCLSSCDCLVKYRLFIIRMLNQISTEIQVESRSALRLRVAEQMLLLMLNEGSGRIYPKSKQYLDYALVGAVIIELVAKGYLRIHQGVIKRLTGDLTNDPIADCVLQHIRDEFASENFTDALHRLSIESHQLIPLVIDNMRKKGVLEPGGDRYVWHVPAKMLSQYPVLKTKAQLHQLLFTNSKPSEQEIAFLWIAHVCNLIAHLFDPESARAIEARVRQLVRFEIINHVISNALSEFHKAVQTLTVPASSKDQSTPPIE